MATLNQMEINSIREVVAGHQMVSAKLAAYSSQCNDPHIKQMFQKASTDAQTSAQKLVAML